MKRKDCFLLWKNWAETQHCKIIQFNEPETKEEVQIFILEVGERKRKNQYIHIRSIGSSHSWAHIFCDPYTKMISSKFLNTILSLDRKRKIVTCEGGVTIWQLGTFLEAHGLSLINYATPGEITVAGMIQTATHGSGNTSTLSEYVRKITLIDSLGQERELTLRNKKREEEKLFLTTNVGIGLTGFVYSVSLKCVKLRFFDKVTWSGSQNLVFKHLDHWIKIYQLEYYSIMWDFRKKKMDLTAYIDSTNLNIHLSNGFIRTKGSNHQTIFQQLIGTGGVRRLEGEYAIPIFDKKGKTLGKLCRRLGPKLIQLNYVPYKTTGVFIRFCNPDHTSYLSPTSIYLNSKKVKSYIWTILRTSPHESEKNRSFFYTMQNFFCVDTVDGIRFLGRFHWAKYWFMNRKLFHQIYGNYEKVFQEWLQNRNRLDPQGKFWNTHFNFMISSAKKTIR